MIEAEKIGALLDQQKALMDTLKGQNLLSEDADVKGDLFEILVNDLGSQKKAAQFRTPHVVSSWPGFFTSPR